MILNKTKLFIIKYLPDILIQVGLLIVITNGGLRSLLPKIDSDASPFAILIFIGVNIAIRRFLEQRVI